MFFLTIFSPIFAMFGAIPRFSMVISVISPLFAHFSWGKLVTPDFNEVSGQVGRAVKTSTWGTLTTLGVCEKPLVEVGCWEQLSAGWWFGTMEFYDFP